MEETRKAVTISGSYRVEMVRVDAAGSRCWVWPPQMADAVRAAAEKRRRLIFNTWSKQKKER